jgi:hypothetical protein
MNPDMVSQIKGAIPSRMYNVNMVVIVKRHCLNVNVKHSESEQPVDKMIMADLFSYT